MSDDRDQFSFLGACLPESFRLRTLTVPPGESIDYRPVDWVDTLVVVEVGELEVECRSGTCTSFQEGAILSFTQLEPCLLRNNGKGALVLSAISRLITP